MGCCQHLVATCDSDPRMGKRWCVWRTPCQLYSWTVDCDYEVALVLCVLSITSSSHLSGRAIAAVPPAECSDTPKISCLALDEASALCHILPMSELDAATNLPQALSTIHQDSSKQLVGYQHSKQLQHASQAHQYPLPLRTLLRTAHIYIYISACASAHQACNQTLHLQSLQCNKCCDRLTFVCEVKCILSYHHPNTGNWPRLRYLIPIDSCRSLALVSVIFCGSPSHLNRKHRSLEMLPLAFSLFDACYNMYNSFQYLIQSVSQQTQSQKQRVALQALLRPRGRETTQNQAVADLRCGRTIFSGANQTEDIPTPHIQNKNGTTTFTTHTYAANTFLVSSERDMQLQTQTQMTQTHQSQQDTLETVFRQSANRLDQTDLLKHWDQAP